MSYMFYGCKNFNQPINNWNISNVKDISYIFSESGFNSALTKASVPKTDIYKKLLKFITDIDLSNGIQDVSWDTSNVNNMEFMFYNNEKFNTLINEFKTENVTNMRNMFNNSSKYNSPINNWNISNVINISSMFNNAIIFNNLIFNETDYNWKLKDMNNIFNN